EMNEIARLDSGVRAQPAVAVKGGHGCAFFARDELLLVQETHRAHVLREQEALDAACCAHFSIDEIAKVRESTFRWWTAQRRNDCGDASFYRLWHMVERQFVARQEPAAAVGVEPVDQGFCRDRRLDR